MLLFYHAVCVDGRWHVYGILGDGENPPTIYDCRDSADESEPQLIMGWHHFGSLWVYESNMPSNNLPGAREGHLSCFLDACECEAVLQGVCHTTAAVMSDGDDVFLLWTAQRAFLRANPERN